MRTRAAGSPAEPKCGFSRRVVEALGGAGCATFGHFDILGDAEVREGLKAFSNWPTYPQLYVKGELLGGCDIVQEMAASGELKTALEAAAKAPGADSVDDRIRALLASAPVMLFMKGALLTWHVADVADDDVCDDSARTLMAAPPSAVLRRLAGGAQVRLQPQGGGGHPRDRGAQPLAERMICLRADARCLGMRAHTSSPNISLVVSSL